MATVSIQCTNRPLTIISITILGGKWTTILEAANHPDGVTSLLTTHQGQVTFRETLILGLGGCAQVLQHRSCSICNRIIQLICTYMYGLIKLMFDACLPDIVILITRRLPWRGELLYAAMAMVAGSRPVLVIV